MFLQFFEPHLETEKDISFLIVGFVSLLLITTLEDVEVSKMSENWLQECRQYLKMLEELSSSKDRDRLDLVRSVRASLSAVNHSLWGWMQYVNNPDIMGKFTKEELAEIDSQLVEFAKNFIEYDVKITQLGTQKGLDEIKRRQREGAPALVV